MKDEASHVALLRFFTNFRDAHQAAVEESTDWGRTPGSVRGSLFSNKDVQLKLQGYSASFRLPERITADVASDLLSRCLEGEVVAAADMSRLLRQTRELLLTEPVVRHFPAPKASGEAVVVVGDLHGCISDLAAVIRLNGEPGPGQTTYIFNGDFVDRGKHSAEVVAAICALKLAHPEHVHLNRGNHECKALTRSYGLQQEIRAKYKGRSASAVFGEISSFFAALPLAAVVGGPGEHVAAVVLHGGPPSDNTVTLAEVAQTAVRDESAAQIFCRQTRSGGEKKVERSTKILEDILWSDPQLDDTSNNVCPNRTRFAGCKYGLGHVHDFLTREGLKTLVRSHEVVYSGLERSDCGEGTELYTVFSASHYPDKRGSNNAASLRFRSPPDVPELCNQECGLSKAEVVRWATSAEDEPAARLDTTTSAHQAKNSVQTLGALITRHKHAIQERLQKAEEEERASGGCAGLASGYISLERWTSCMKDWGEGAGVSLPTTDWQALLPLLRVTGGTTICEEEEARPDVVNYPRLLAGFDDVDDLDEDDGTHGLSESAIMSLYTNHEELAMIFTWMDADGNGSLSLDEVTQACETLNRRDASKQEGGENIDAEALFRAMDIDRSGQLDLHEFMECFRLTAKKQADAEKLTRATGAATQR